ncbi:unnamed protein product [Leptidea sinapis]|uniref:DUF4780 domain-containing protein n=1 Tax=Leptidea sinapis TaxID=189913 RepID=A0A5E4Q5Y1_9NEOP|nr:unnamed protein product [Leptidea sinapis]
MLITILGLPLSTKYHEIKVLITQKCGIPDFILDNLLTDTDGTKKVRVGLADDAEGAHVIKCLNGYKLSGNVLRVVPFGKSGIARQNNSAPNHRSTFETQGYQNDFNQMGRSQVDPWGSHSQWTPQQQTGHIQNQNNLSYQQNRQGVLRTVEIVETPPQNLPGRHQPNYDLQRDRNGHEQKMDSYEKSDYGKYMPQDKRILKEQLAMKYKELDKPQYDPHEKKMLKEQLAMKYKHLEKSQYSPQNMHARGLQPRQVSPSPRHSPGRKMTGRMRSPPRRSVSPHGRRLSPPGRRLSPSGRRPSPSAGRTSPMGRSRRMSPGRRVSPAGRNPMEPPVDRRMPSSGMMAHGRPASNQEMYSGGYRPNDTAQYNLQNVRSEGSSSRWTVRDKHFGKNLDDDRRDVLRMAKFETPRSSDTARVIEDVHGPRSSNRGSRSPRRERSPLRDRYRRHSPSPRSPRRSWALEKRRSPEVPDEAPPPPVWTAESPKQADYRDSRHSYTHAEQTRRQWVPISQSKKEEEARVRQSRHDSRERIRQEAQEMHFRAEEKEQVDFLKIKEDLTRRIEQKAVILKKQEELQKEIEDVYKRAVDFTKKAERHRKGDQRRDDHSAVEKQAQRDIRFDRKDEKRPKPQNNSISFAIKTKRQKATEELADKILSKFGENLPELIKAQVFEQICDAVSKILNDMYSDNDVSFIEAVIKFNSRHNVKDEEKIFDNVMSKFPLQYRVLKRSAEECVPPPPKTPKMATDVADVAQPAILYAVPNWDYSYAQNNSIMEIVNASKAYIAQNNMNKNMQNYSTFVQPEQNVVPEIVEPDQNVLYLCKDDFDPINSSEAVDLKNFLVQSMIEASNISRGVTPDFTLKGLQSVFRYEVEARDAASKEWLINLDFQKFRSFNVLVYTKEELWYERAAIWLPGHSSRYDKLKPFDKLRLQNKLDGVDLGKWKLVKQVVTLKGVRLYVDMPPSSARALEKHKMKLSYELQKVDVYLKAVAVDKDAFDAGLKVKSIEPPVETATMSSLPQDTKIIKFALKGDKPISMPIARKIKSNIVSNIFKYLTNGGKSKIDVVKYGIAHPGYFGLLPENDDTRRWFLNYNSGFGMVNKLPVVIVGGNDQTRYVRMEIFLPPNVVMAATSALEKLRSSNHGVKKLNITKWKAIKINKHRSMNKSRLEVEIDIESVETLRKMGFKLDFVISANQCYSVDVRSVDSERNLINMLEKYKSEQSDSYEVSNMDIASSDDDVSNIYWEKQGQENCLCKALHIYLVSSIKHKREEDANTGVLYSFRRLMVLSVLVEDFQKLEQHMGRFCNMQHVIAKKPRLVAAKPSEPPKKYTPVEKDEGSAHVTVTPCYRFMKCPEGLKTKFVDESDAEKDTSLVSENAEKKSEDTTEIIKSADESQKINDGNKKEDELKVAKTIKIEEADNTNKVETAREIAIEANTNISEKMKTEEPSMPQKITSKIIPDVKKEVSKAEEGKKMEVNKNKLTKVNETTIEKSSPQVESVEKTLKDTNAKIVENKPTVKQEFVKNVAKIQTQGKTITKPVNSLQAQTKRVEVKKNLKNVSKADDFEEMADDEILALLSSGVVLDECGSDEE